MDELEEELLLDEDDEPLDELEEELLLEELDEELLDELDELEELLLDELLEELEEELLMPPLHTLPVTSGISGEPLDEPLKPNVTVCPGAI